MELRDRFADVRCFLLCSDWCASFVLCVSSFCPLGSGLAACSFVCCRWACEHVLDTSSHSSYLAHLPRGAPSSLQWFSFHLANFGFLWPWNNWDGVKQLPDSSARKSFVRDVRSIGFPFILRLASICVHCETPLLTVVLLCFRAGADASGSPRILVSV